MRLQIVPVAVELTDFHAMNSPAPILEVAVLNVRAGASAEFETAFQTASAIISSMPGYIAHELRRCVEDSNRYILLVQWRTLEDHTIGFRQSPEYQRWRSLLHHFYDPFPTVDHYGPPLGAYQVNAPFRGETK